MSSMTDRVPDREPTRRELAAIEREWPQIVADLESLDAEIRRLSTSGTVDELRVRRARREGHRVLRAPVVRGSFGGEAA